ncbi:MAG: hypothetical protein HKN32_06430 [Flavobacteriales bacterium]|nr:hypothetical protein [Flavobacteriales bacterium]
MAPFTLIGIAGFTALFWITFELANNQAFQVIYAGGNDAEYAQLSQVFNGIATLFLLPALFVILFFVNKPRMKMHYTWMMVAAGGLLILASELITISGNNFNLPVLLIFYLFCTVAEILYPAFVMSHVSRLVGSKFTATAFSLFMMIFAGTAAVNKFLFQEVAEIAHFFSEILLVFVLVGLILIKVLGIKERSF